MRMATTTQPTETVEQRLAVLEKEFTELRAQLLGLKPLQAQRDLMIERMFD